MVWEEFADRIKIAGDFGRLDDRDCRRSACRNRDLSSHVMEERLECQVNSVGSLRSDVDHRGCIRVLRPLGLRRGKPVWLDVQRRCRTESG